MMDLFEKQYGLLCGSRMVMLDFIEKELPGQLAEPIPAFDGSTVRYLLIHTANTYKFWLGNFGMNMGLPFTDDKTVMDMESVRKEYTEANDLVCEFLNKFAGTWEKPLVNQYHGNEIALTPLQLFTHVLTHEFHHKGQIMTMCRLLGHTPPDTDIIRNG